MSPPSVNILIMADETWRPLGVETEDQIAEYDALHEGVPVWLDTALWAWIRNTITTHRRYRDGSGRFPMVQETLVEAMCQTLQIGLPAIRMRENGAAQGEAQFKIVMAALKQSQKPLMIVDYLLAHADQADDRALDAALTRSKSAWQVGERTGRVALVRRVPKGVQVAADAVIASADRAGARLASAWEALYGIEPNASAAYGLAIKAVEDAAIPVVSPNNQSATLGTVLKQMENQTDWLLPMKRLDDQAPPTEVLIGMARMLWHGQHDRHGGQPSAPGDVSMEEATVAVSLAVTLVNLFSAGLVERASKERKFGPGISAGPTAP